MKIIRKITLKLVTGGVDFDKLMAAPDQKMELMTVFGVAGRARAAESDLGSYVRFSGQFRALDTATGEEFSSTVLILPSAAQDLLLGVMDTNDADISVRFGFKISVHYDKSAATKYVYDVESIFAPEENDPMEIMSKQVKQALLPAPEDDKKEGKKGGK